MSNEKEVLSENIRQEIEYNLKQHKISSACYLLFNTIYHEQAIIISSELEQLKKRQLRGVILEEELRVRENQIVEIILNLINKDSFQELGETKRIKDSYVWKKFVVIISLSLFVASLVVFFIIGFVPIHNNTRSLSNREVHTLEEFVQVTGKVSAAVNRGSTERLPDLLIDFEEIYHAKIEIITDVNLRRQLRDFKDSIEKCINGYLEPDLLLMKGKDLSIVLNHLLEKSY